MRPSIWRFCRTSPSPYLGRIENAGEILLGDHTPVTLGNFVVGPNHVLPTSGWARTALAASVFDFMKRTSVAYVTAGAIPSSPATPVCSPAMRVSTPMPTPSPTSEMIF